MTRRSPVKSPVGWVELTLIILLLAFVAFLVWLPRLVPVG
jgi:hypothetical protein